MSLERLKTLRDRRQWRSRLSSGWWINFCGFKSQHSCLHERPKFDYRLSLRWTLNFDGAAPLPGSAFRHINVVWSETKKKTSNEIVFDRLPWIIYSTTGNCELLDKSFSCVSEIVLILLVKSTASSFQTIRISSRPNAMDTYFIQFVFCCFFSHR